MHLDSLAARPCTGRISMVSGRYIAVDLVTKIFAGLTINQAQKADQWLQRLAHGWARSFKELDVYLDLSGMIQNLVRRAKAMASKARLSRFLREAEARKQLREEALRRSQEDDVPEIVPEEDDAEEGGLEAMIAMIRSLK